MKRIFNTTGTCIPARHFVADISGKVAQVMELIARGDYFTINRPRQYGKTTLLYHLFQEMQKDKDYLALDISFEGIGTSSYESADRFIPAVLDILSMRLEFMDEKETAALLEKNRKIDNFGE
jgi:predicted AAA+ superfamily ATPase